MKPTQSRMTKQRKVILEELRKVSSHPTAEELYSLVRGRMPHVSLGTVYRNLDFLAGCGEILQLNAAGSTRRFDGDTHPHCHVRCLGCGCVGDVSQSTMLFPPLPSAQDVHADGFSIAGARLEFDGYCDACREAMASNTTRAQAGQSLSGPQHALSA